MRRLLAGAMVIAMLVSGLPPASATVANDDALRGPPALLAALNTALADTPAPNPEGVFVPTPEGAKAYALGVLAADGTPERLAAVLDDLALGRDVSMRDYLLAGTLLHYAGPGYAGDTLSRLARGVVEAALPMRVAANPVAVQGELPEVPALPEVPSVAAPEPRSFGPMDVLATTGRVLRVDDLEMQSSELLDIDAVYREVSSSYATGAFSSTYYNYYSDYWSYAYYTSYYGSGSSSYSSYYAEIAESLLRFRSEFEHWQFTSGVDVQVFEQSAEVGSPPCVAAPEVPEQCIDAPATAHMLYTVVTPYAFIDHWWLMIFLEELSQQVYESWSNSYSGYWYQGVYSYYYNYDYYGYYYYYDQANYAYDGSGSSATQSHWRTYWTDSGSDRVPIPHLPVLSDLRIRVFAPLDQYVALAQADGTVVDMSTAATVALPNQVGVEYKDAKLSELLATIPAFSDLSIVVDEEPYASNGLTAVDEVALTGDSIVVAVSSAAAGAAGSVAIIGADPGAVAQATAAALEAAATGAGSDAESLVLTVQADPAGFVASNVDEALAAAGAAAADLQASVQDGVTAEVPDVQDAAFLVAEYASSVLHSQEVAGAGVGLVSLRAYPADSDLVVVRVDATGLGLPVIFQVDLQRGTAIPNEIAIEPPEAPVSEGAGIQSLRDPRDDLQRSAEALLAMPPVTSLPAFLAQERILDNPVGWAKAHLQSTLTSEHLASTLALMGATSADRPVRQADLVDATVVLWFAGAGYEEDPAFGAWARDMLAAALPAYIAAGGPLAAAEPPGLPPEAQAVVDEATAASEGAVAGVNGAVAPTVDAATNVPLDDLRSTTITGRALRWNTILGESHGTRSSTGDYLSRYANGYAYTNYVTSYYAYYNWYYYQSYYGDYNEQTGWTQSYERTQFQYEQLSSLFTRIDVVDSITAAMVVLGGTQHVAADVATPAELGGVPCPPEAPACAGDLPGASVDEPALDGNVVYTVLFPFQFNANWYLSTVFESYRTDYLSLYEYYAAYYDSYGSYGYDSWGYWYNYGTSSSSSSGSDSYSTTFVQTNFRTDTGAQIVPVPNIAISPGTEIVVQIPMKEYALMARGPAPFDMGTVSAGDLPFQLPVTREGTFFGDHLVLSPAPNDLNLVVDEDALLGGPGAGAAQAELQAMTTAAELEARLDSIAADPVAAIGGMLPAVDSDALAASLQEHVDGVVAAVPGPASLQAMAEGTAAALVDIVSNPQPFVDATAAQAVADVRATTVSADAHDLPRDVDDRAVYEAVYQAKGLASFTPAMVVVGLVGLDGATVIDPEQIVVTIRAQGLEGNDALGATGPLALRFATDLNGDGPTPTETPSASANVGEALDSVPSPPPAPVAGPAPREPLAVAVARDA